MVQLSEITNVKSKTDLKVIIHGWNSSGKQGWVNNMKNGKKSYQISNYQNSQGIFQVVEQPLLMTLLYHVGNILIKF